MRRLAFLAFTGLGALSLAACGHDEAPSMIGDGNGPSPDVTPPVDTPMPRPTAGPIDTCGPPEMMLAMTSIDAAGLAIDDADVYWAERDGELWRVPKCGGTAIALHGNERTIDALALHGGFLYWSAWAEEPTHSLLKRWPVDGSWTMEVLAELTDHPTAIAVDDEAVYWVTGVEVAKLDHGATKPTRLSEQGSTSPGFAVDATHVYWFDTKDSIARVTKAGGATGAFAVDENAQPWMAVDATDVFWPTYIGDGNYGVKKVSKTDGHSSLFGATRGAPAGIALSQTRMYVATYQAGMWVMPKQGGDVARLSDAACAFPALDATRAYCVGLGEVVGILR